MRYKNPIIPGFHPDPSICRVGDDYYLVASSFGFFPGVPVYHSKNLVHWKQIGHCLTRRSQLELAKMNISASGVYAPTIRHHEGKFYMITTNVKPGGGNFFVWTENPAGEWSDPVWIDMPGIDPSLFFDDDGRVYYTGSSDGIRQCEINIKTGRRLTESVLIWKGTGGAYPEGPHMYKINGMYYLLISEGGTEHCHMVTVARSERPGGPFESCPRNPVLTHRSLNLPVKAVGHADLVQAHDGSWWCVCLGIRPVSYPYRHHLGRETFLAPVSWDDEGWPVIGNNGTIGLEMEAPCPEAAACEDAAASRLKTDDAFPAEARAAGSGGRDDFNGDKLKNCWNFIYNPNDNDWSLRERKGCLTLKGSGVTLDDDDSPAFIGRRQEHFLCRIRTLLYFNPAQNGEEAGLTVFLNCRHHYEAALALIDGKRRILFRRRIGSLWKVENSVEYAESSVILGIDANHEKYVFSYAKMGGKPSIIGEGETQYLSTEVGGTFTGVYFGLYATGNGKQSITPAYFDWFEYIPGVHFAHLNSMVNS